MWCFDHSTHKYSYAIMDQTTGVQIANPVSGVCLEKRFGSKQKDLQQGLSGRERSDLGSMLLILVGRLSLPSLIGSQTKAERVNEILEGGVAPLNAGTVDRFAPSADALPGLPLHDMYANIM
jgi:hypothetical protein